MKERERERGINSPSIFFITIYNNLTSFLFRISCELIPSSPIFLSTPLYFSLWNMQSSNKIPLLNYHVNFDNLLAC